MLSRFSIQLNTSTCSIMSLIERIAALIIIVGLSHDFGLAFTIPKNETNSRMKIIGGQLADISSAPHHVQLVAIEVFCGGSLITRKHVLTAAHCIDEARKFGYVTVMAGSDELNEYIEKRKGVEFAVHPYYSRATIDGTDIAIITVNRPFKDKRIKTISMPRNPPRVGESVNIYGFGAIHRSGRQSQNLKKFKSRTIPCMFDEDICVKSTIFDGMCFGDSGGGLINKDNEIIGISSRVFACASGQPDVYSSVYNHRKFIKSYLKGNIGKEKFNQKSNVPDLLQYFYSQQKNNLDLLKDDNSLGDYQQYYIVPQQQQDAPQQYFYVPQQQQDAPQQYYYVPQQQQNSPQQYYYVPQQQQNNPQQYYYLPNYEIMN